MNELAQFKSYLDVSESSESIIAITHIVNKPIPIGIITAAKANTTKQHITTIAAFRT
jgi:hypothetical protein